MSLAVCAVVTYGLTSFPSPRGREQDPALALAMDHSLPKVASEAPRIPSSMTRSCHPRSRPEFEKQCTFGVENPTPLGSKDTMSKNLPFGSSSDRESTLWRSIRHAPTTYSIPLPPGPPGFTNTGPAYRGSVLEGRLFEQRHEHRRSLCQGRNCSLSTEAPELPHRHPDSTDGTPLGRVQQPPAPDSLLRKAPGC